jgi:hypothetical protein
MSADMVSTAGMRVTRGLLLVAGTVVAGVGAWKLLQTGPGNTLAAARWLVGGVVAHDAVLAPLTVVIVVAGSRILPTWLRAPVTAGVVILGTVTIAAIPVLGRFGARPDNPTLLDRNYVAGWLVFAGLVVLAVSVAAWRRHRAATAVRFARRRTPVR